MSEANGNGRAHGGSAGGHPRTANEDWRVLRDNCLEDILADRRRQEKLKPLTRNQEIYFKAVETSTVTICVGPAGTGKTYMACGIAAEMLKDGRIDRIVLARPLLACDEELGFLKGGLEEKVGPYVVPMLDAFDNFFTSRELVRHVEQETIEVCPLAIMRGRTFRRAVVILDEAQNATFGQLRMFLTRFGEGTRVVVCGDATQSDLPPRHGSPLVNVIDRLWGHPDIAVVRLTRDDVVRHGLIQWIDERLAG